MLELLSRVLGETIEIATYVQPGIWHALADPGQVENAILNLALNARDAMPDGGKLTIECTNERLDGTSASAQPDAKAGKYVVLTVSDTGCGMSAETLEHASDPFFTTKEVGQGSGLGLSMVYGFAKQSGGHLTIESSLADGTTVKLYLPSAEERRVSSAPAIVEGVPRGHGQTVLVIEDDADVRSLTARMLEDLGYMVIDVFDATQARETLEEGALIDVVLSDIVLPGGTSGPDFVRQARVAHPELKVIFMSGYAAMAGKHDDLESLSCGLLNKPFKVQQLAEAIYGVLD